MLISDDVFESARRSRLYWIAVWVGRLLVLAAVGWAWLLFGVRPIEGSTVIPYWLGMLVLVVIIQVLLSRAGLPFLPRFLDWRKQNRWVERAFYRDVLWLRRR